MKRFLIIIAAFTFICAGANAQSFLDRLGNTAKNAFENNINNKVDRGVNDVLDGNVHKSDNNSDENRSSKKNKKSKDEAEGWTCPECGHEGNTGKFCGDCGAKKPAEEAKEAGWKCPECGTKGNTGKFCNECGAKRPDGGSAGSPSADRGASKPAEKKQTATNYAKSDFVPGDEIIFEDNFENEKLGEFPSQWDLMDGYVEVGEVDGRKVIAFTDNGYGEIKPLMKDPKHFLPDVFTIEYDLYTETSSGDIGEHVLETCFGNPDIECWNGYTGWGTYWFRSDDLGSHLTWEFEKPNGGDNVRGEKDLYLESSDSPQKEGWNHFAWSFNKRALKGYVNGVRIVNIPNAKVPTHFWFHHEGSYKYSCISNVRIAKGAVPLYDRLMNDGKIITYAITFDTGKATIKPESYTEINRIAKLMQENPNLNFEVQGHCDAQGSDKVNDPLSQKRAEAIVAALVDLGIAKARLSAVGKGSHNPIASNSTDEGRAKNRRVEFVKK